MGDDQSGAACNTDDQRWAWHGQPQANQAAGNRMTDRQKSLPEHLRERGVAVIRPKGQNSSRVRGRRREESVREGWGLEGRGGACQEAGS